ncbi:glycosyl hydrolase 5 family protein-like [Salvia miltiorrhiza]|uniref:glycosyl hydrolase 5 family protein-like n=1 Tax=Salvia miltiorrhiza TaxID=226208 RepID=UPI0025AD1889|nr:glycosyl hydrolase 5 family protein-like [Salvia miltiorrhiza]
MKKILGHLLLLSLANLCFSLPLSTRSRWIVDDHSRARVKLACTNWAAHLEPMLAEGLDKKPVDHIATHVKEMGYNCVRLTWATYMFTRYATTTVAQSFRSLELHEAADGIARNNPGFLNLTVVDAQRAVVEELVRKGLMVVLDNHVSQPMWCCGDHDGNGFFGDENFDANEWLHGLEIVAKRYKHTPMVVGMSMRNELRGTLQNSSVWYKYVQKGARTIHKANPNLLVIVSGLHYDLSFEFLKQKPLKKIFKNKLVFEFHRYAFSTGQRNLWLTQPFHTACDRITREIEKEAGFLIKGENAAPLFASEFGIKQVEMGRVERLFLGCFVGYLAEMDLDWSVWALQGGYYIRDGVRGLDETYGMLDSDWSSIRNPDFHQQLQLIQHKIQEPNSKGPTYQILYHPLSGRCIHANNSEVEVGDCLGFSEWSHDENGHSIQLIGTELCLSTNGKGKAVTLSEDCNSRESRWELVSNTKFQVANRDANGDYLCLEWDPNNSSRVVANKCFCLEQDASINCLHSPQTQWFKLISGNVR